MSTPRVSADILDAFASAYIDDPQALSRFVSLHPDQAVRLVAYAHEINLQASCREDAEVTPDDEEWIAAQVAALSGAEASDPFARWTPAEFQTARRTLGVPSSVLMAFRDRVVEPASVPLPFLDRLSTALGVDLKKLAAFLTEPPRLAPAVSYKSDGAPAAPSEKTTFATILNDAGVPDDKLRELLDEDD